MAKKKAKQETAKIGRASWKGSIAISSDSLLSIGVKAYKGRISEIPLKTLHAECQTPVKQEVNCPVCGPIERGDTSKGHEWAKDRLVTFTTEEIEELKVTRESIVTVDCYIPTGFIHTFMATDKTYYLLPADASAQQAYQVWRDALAELDVAAACELCITSPAPAAIYAESGLLMCTVFEYAENIKAIEDFTWQLLPIPTPQRIKDDAKRMIKRHLKKTFTWQQFKDERRQRLQAMIDEKVQAGESMAPGLGVMDLKELFQADQAKKKRKAK